MRTTLRLVSLTSLLLLPSAACNDSSANDAGVSDTGTGDGDGDLTTTTTTTGDGDGDPTTGDGDGDPTTGDGDGDPTTGDGDGDPTTGDGDGDPPPCVVTECAGKVYECGDCVDNDEDGLIDTNDPNCWGPCDNNESGFKGNIPGQNQAPCTVMDCYFDSDSGTGNDNCYWSHSCDPSEPNPSSCTYNGNGMIPGSSMSCSEAQESQSEQCLDVCEPLVPNGCDCFGCCEINSGNDSFTVFLGSGDGEGTCTFEDVADPTKCAPCVQVEGCFNPCEPENCEICIGETEVPDDCEEAGCPDGIQSCDPANNSADCPDAFYCLTGCCYPLPG
jgi:hypothetical protein